VKKEAGEKSSRGGCGRGDRGVYRLEGWKVCGEGSGRDSREVARDPCAVIREKREERMKITRRRRVS
jgi:hypothetical protein